MRNRLLPGSDRLPYEDRALGTAVQVCGASRTVDFHMEMQPAVHWVRLFESLPRCMALPRNAMKIKRADWKTADLCYQTHGGGGGEKWIPLERPASGSVTEDPRRAERRSRRGAVLKMDFSRLRNIVSRYVSPPPPVHHYCHNCVCKSRALGSWVYALRCTKLPGGKHAALEATHCGLWTCCRCEWGTCQWLHMPWWMCRIGMNLAGPLYFFNELQHAFRWNPLVCLRSGRLVSSAWR